MKKVGLLFSTLLIAVFFSLVNSARAADSFDLKVDSLTLDLNKCEYNRICGFTAKVENLGSSFTIGAPLKASVSSANFDLVSIAGSAGQGELIKTNDYITFTWSGIYSVFGAATMTFSVDAASNFTDSNTSNNTASLNVNVLGYDLAVEEITILPPYPRVNQTCFVQIKVKNNSSYNLYSETGLNIIRNFPDLATSQASSTIPSFNNLISPGGYLYWSYEGKFTASGEKKFSFIIDPDDVLKESNTANNAITKTITVYNQTEIDLAIDSVTSSVSKIILGEPLDITVGVRNKGKASLTDALGLTKDDFIYNLPHFDYGVNDITMDAYPTLSTPLNPAGVFYYKFHGIFNQPGNFNLDFSVNKNQQLPEATFANNSSTTPVVVYKSLADADSFSFVSKSLSLVSSTTAIISWTTDLNTTGILNYGRAHYNINENQAVAAENALKHTITLNSLKPGENYIYTITAKNGTAEKNEMLASFAMPEDDVLRLVSGPSLSLNDKTADFSWTTNLISSGLVYYKKKEAAAFISAGSDTAVAEHKVELKDLAYGSYDYFLSSTSTPKTSLKTGWSSFEIKAPAVESTSTPTAVAPAGNTATLVSFPITNAGLYEKLKGKIILRVESKGEAYYISAKEKKMYFLGKPEEAFQVVRQQAIGMTNANLAKIPAGLSTLSGQDSDNDGLPDALEIALGTDQNKSDTDADGSSDKTEITNGYSPLEKNKQLVFDKALALKFKGQILLQVQGRGQAWYVNPADGKKYFLNRPADAFNIMRRLGLGVTNVAFQSLGGK